MHESRAGFVPLLHWCLARDQTPSSGRCSPDRVAFSVQLHRIIATPFAPSTSSGFGASTAALERGSLRQQVCDAVQLAGRSDMPLAPYRPREGAGESGFLLSSAGDDASGGVKPTCTDAAAYARTSVHDNAFL
jgi:hypothetical protein